jgi:hypothetical protein
MSTTSVLMPRSDVKEDGLSAIVASGRMHRELPSQVTFGVVGLYGLSDGSVQLPLNETECIDSGQVCITLDPHGAPAGNVGSIDFRRERLIVRYDGQLVFPGLYDLVTRRQFDAELLNPVRVTATDECVLLPDLSGWRAEGCLEFLPGSIWANASGG